MNKTIQKCALCWESRVLKNSHLIPKAIYRRLKRGVAQDLGSPARVNPSTGTTVLSDYQPTMQLLCFECEQRFSAKGEDIVIPQVRSADKFPLRDTSMNGTNLVRCCDTAGNAALKKDAYFYFAASLAWRMSVANWPKPYNAGYQQLGAHEEYFRVWLLGDVATIPETRVEILVDLDSNSPALGGPDVSKHSDLSMGASIFQLTALGVWFRVHVGGNLSDRGVELFGSYKNSIAFRKVSFGGMGMGQYVDRLVRETTYKGKLAKLR